MASFFNVDNEVMDKAEYMLRIIAKVTLCIGLLASIICLFTICWVDNSAYYIHETKFNPVGFVITIGTALFSVTAYALLNVIANISDRLSIISARYEYSEEEMISEDMISEE